MLCVYWLAKYCHAMLIVQVNLGLLVGRFDRLGVFELNKRGHDADGLHVRVGELLGGYVRLDAQLLAAVQTALTVELVFGAV